MLTQANVKDLCVTCHSDKAELIEKAKVQHPGAAGDCTDCHNPHASSVPGLPKTNRSTSAWAATPIRPISSRRRTCISRHSSRRCAICHEPHGGENEHLLRTKKTNDLCLECHGPDARPKKLESEHLIALFNGTVKLPEDYFTKNKVVVLPIKYGHGHPVEWPPGCRCTRSIRCHQDLREDRLPVVPPAACVGAARSAGEGPG